MTTETTTAPAPARPRRATFGNVVSAEWTKVLTVRSTFWTLLAGIIVTIGLSLLLAWAFTSQYGEMSAADRAEFDPAAYSLAGVNFGMVAFGVLGVLVITGEYATGMIRTSLIAMPRRVEFLAAKALALGAVTLIVGVLVSFASFLPCQLIFKSQKIDASLGDDGVLRAVVGGGLYLALIALLALGIGALLRHTAGSVSVILGVLFVLPIIAQFLPGDWASTVSRFLPSGAGGAVMSVKPAEGVLSPWTGFAVLVLYTVVVLAAALFAIQKRDA
ncbi:ABC transporter permease subunit [Actinomadura rudentiformis]|uniref:ABC transporter permease subunit n=1 Tax=Actinomadura rudentiformis TaxID=359158 RepID=A0A6H9YGR4_9ACTN|nr:ABC transporter permease subunit [Actinomadura rudentiformis]KAB2343049.1 ABC transporter permease subunit [Actinomadura rudentiformis]